MNSKQPTPPVIAPEVHAEILSRLQGAEKEHTEENCWMSQWQAISTGKQSCLITPSDTCLAPAFKQVMKSS